MDPAYKQQTGQSSSSEETDLDQQRGKQKRTKVGSDDEGALHFSPVLHRVALS